MKNAAVNGIELAYEVQGVGEPVLLISTGPIADSFLPLFSQEDLANRYQLIRYRQRRMAPEECCEPVSFRQHAADAAALLQHLDIQRSHVAGHSTGADIALQLAVDNPKLVGTLALLEPPLMSVPSAGNFFESVSSAISSYESGHQERAMTEFLSVVCSLEWQECQNVMEKGVSGAVNAAIEGADNFFRSYLPALNSWEFGEDQAADIHQPVLSIRGTETNRLFVDGRELLRSWLPQLEECTIEGVAHLLHMQEPKPVAGCMAEFFSRHPLA